MSQPQNACSPSVPSADNDLLLRQIKIAAPCSAKWEAMPGGERVRSCAQCSHKVYNLSAMSGDEAATLIRQAEGRVCVRLYRRADGSVMTQDCPTGLRAARLRVGRAVAASFASVFSILGLFTLAERFHAKPAPAAITMGAVAVSPQTVSTPIPHLVANKIISEKHDSGYEMGDMSIAPSAPKTFVMGQLIRPAMPLPMIAPTPDADKTFLPHESEPNEIRSDPFAPLPKEKSETKSSAAARP